MVLKAVFLDVGNTLLSEEPSRFAIYAEVARRRGREVDAEVMRALMGAAHRALPREIDGSFRYSDGWFRAYIQRIFGEELELEDQLEAIVEELFQRFEDARTFRLYPGALELTSELRRAGLTVGVVSNWSSRLPRVLRATGLEGSFDFVLCSAIERMEKPEPAIFEAALERAGVRPQEALHAGDHPVLDGEGARRVGIETVLVDHAGTLDPASARSTPRVGSLDELRSYILERDG